MTRNGKRRHGKVWHGMTSEGDAGASLHLISASKATHQRTRRERILKKDAPVLSTLVHIVKIATFYLRRYGQNWPYCRKIEEI
jgi:hypothetical protein